MLAMVSAKFQWLVLLNLKIVSDHRRTKAFQVALHVLGLNTQLILVKPETKDPGEARRNTETPG